MELYYILPIVFASFYFGYVIGASIGRPKKYGIPDYQCPPPPPEARDED